MRKFRVIFGCIILATAFAFVFILFFNTLRADEKVATAYVAFGTLTLAFATALLAMFTFFSLMSGNEREKRDRKERLLNEIIKWAEDINKCGINPDIELYINLRAANGDTKKERVAEEKHREQLLSLILTISKRIKYMNKIAPKIDRGLYDTMTEVVNNLNQQVKLLTESLTGLRQVSTTEIGLQIQKLGNSADKLIEKATEIQAKDIG